MCHRWRWEKVYDVIFGDLSNEKEIIISFDGVTDLTPTFLNNVIGRLYGKFKKDFTSEFFKKRSNV